MIMTLVLVISAVATAFVPHLATTTTTTTTRTTTFTTRSESSSLVVITSAAPHKKGKKSRDERMEQYYRERWGDGAAAEFKFARERDKAKYGKKRAARLGAKEGEEYDLEAALAANTDDGITKIIAGSFIFAVFVGIYVGVLAPVLSPATFTDSSGVVYVRDASTGVFVEK